MVQKPRSNRWNGWLKRKPSLLRPFPALRMEELEVRDVPATYTWTGLGANPNWSLPANWIASPNTAPPAPTGMPQPSGSGLSYDDLVFPEGPSVRTAVNDILTGTFNSISFSTTTTGAGYTLTGSSLILGVAGFPGTGFVNVNATSTGNDIQIDMTLGTATPAFPSFVQTFNVDGALVVSGKLASDASSGLIKSGAGNLTLAADNSNLHGTIAVNPSSGILTVTNSNALGDTLRGTTIGTNSSLDLSSVAGLTIGEGLTLNGPGVDSNGALFNLIGTKNVWNGPITLNTGDSTVGVVIGAEDATKLTINGIVSDGAVQPFSKEGKGEVVLNAANTYRGLTLINSGILTVGNAKALGADGSANNGTIVRSDFKITPFNADAGQLRLASPSLIGFTIRDEFLTLNGAGQQSLLPGFRGSLTNTNADNTWAGPVTLGSPTPNGVDVTIGTGQGTLTISGVISTPNGIGNNPAINPPFSNGSTTLHKIDSGTLIFNNANTYSCPTFIDQGILIVRDSQSLGEADAVIGVAIPRVTVADGATLQLDVEAGAGPFGTVLQPVNPLTGNPEDAHGRNLSDDSITHDANRLQIANPLTLNGRGVNVNGTSAGSLFSDTGINIWTEKIVTNEAAIGVALDPRAGHPTPDSTYFVSDYSLTTTNTIVNTPGNNSSLAKVQPGQLILPVANTYTGRTFVENGWVTIQNNRSLGARIPNLAQTLQPETFVYDGAAVHLRTLTPDTDPLFIDENLILAGIGPKLPYRFISQKGALMNIGGDNIVGLDSLVNPIWSTYVAFNGIVGIGVEQIAPLVPDSHQDPSRLTILGWTRDDSVTNPAQSVQLARFQSGAQAKGGITKYGSKLLLLEGEGTYSLTTDIKEGIISARHNTALGQATSGTYNATSGATPETYSQTDTIVESAANLWLDSSNVLTSGGITSGIQVAHEQLVLNAAGQQIAVAGALVPAPSQYFLTFTNHLTDVLPDGVPTSDAATKRTTGPLAAGATAAELEAELNALGSVKSNEVQELTTKATGVFTLSFTHNGQTATTTTPVGGIPAGAPASTIQDALQGVYGNPLLPGIPTIRRHETQNVVVVGGVAANSFTLTFKDNSGVTRTTAPIPYGSTALVVQNALNALTNIGPLGVSVVEVVVPGGKRYTVTFDGLAFAYTNQNQMTGVGIGFSGPVISTPAPFGDGFGGTVSVRATGPTTYAITFGGELGFENVSLITAAGTAVAPTPATATRTLRDGLNGSVKVTESYTGTLLNPFSPPGSVGPVSVYTIEYFGDLANVDLPQIFVQPLAVNATGTKPTAATLQTGGPGVDEKHTISVVSSSSVLADGSVTGSYTLSYKGQTTDYIPITAPPSLAEFAINAKLTTLTSDIAGPVVVTKASNVFTAVFNQAHSADTPRLVATSLVSSLGTPEVTISGNTDVAESVGSYVSQASLVSQSLDNAWRGPVVLNSGGRVAITENTRINFLGSVSDATNAAVAGSNLVKRGQGEILLAGLNTYRGTSFIDTGLVTVANSNALGTTTGGTIVANNAQLQIQGSLTVAGEALTIQGTGVQDPSTLKDKWFNVGPSSTNNVATAGGQTTSARITSVTTDPTDSNVIYVATAGGGAWKSKDRGITWTPLFDDTVDQAAVMYGGQIVVAPGNSNVVYFATGEGNGGPNGSPIGGQRDGFAGTGVYISVNAGVTWRLLTGPGSFNPIYGLAVTKLIVDPTNARRIYIATGNSSVINGGVYQLTNNAFGTAVAGVYRYDGTGTSGTPTWVNLTGSSSLNRATVPGNAPFDAAGGGPPGNAGPDDDYRIKFPQTNATWSDIALVASGRSNLLYGAGANAISEREDDGNIRGKVWVLYAALGESQQAYYNGTRTTQGVFNAVYRTEEPASTFAPGSGPGWWIGAGTSFPVAEVDSKEIPLDLPAIPPPTVPDGEAKGTYYNIGPQSDPVDPTPTERSQYAPGRNEWIRVTAVVTRYFNVNPADNQSNLLNQNQTENASIQVYAVDLGNSISVPTLQLQYFPYGTNNRPYGRTGEFLGFQVSAWDGAIGNGWNPNIGKNAAINKDAAGFSSSPFGVNTATTNATGRYDDILVNPSRTSGLVDLTPLVNQRLYLGGKTDVWSADVLRTRAADGTVTYNASQPWTPITQNKPATPADYVHSLFIDISTGNLLIGSDGGIWYDKNNGVFGGADNFQNMNGNITAAQVNNIDPHPTDVNQALAAAYNSGLQKFAGGLAWNAATLPTTNLVPGDDRLRDAGDVRYDPKNPLNAFASVGGNLYRTQDGGVTWTYVLTDGPPLNTPTGTTLNNANRPNSFPVYVDPINPKRVLIGGTDLLETTTSDAAAASVGATFVNLSGGSSAAIAPAVYQGTFVADPSFPQVTDKLSNFHDTDTIYTTDGTTVRLTKNHGVTWVARGPFAPVYPYRLEYTGSLAITNVATVAVISSLTGFGATGTLVNGNFVGNEIQTLTVSATGGFYQLQLLGDPNLVTGPIPWDAPSTVIENAINALPGFVNVGGTRRVVVTAGFQNNVITDIAVDPSNRDTVYATVRHRNGFTMVQDPTLGTVYRTTDAGRTWTNISGSPTTAVPVSYTATDTPKTVPDNDPLGTTSSVTVAAAPGQIVTNIRVTVDISTLADGDLRLYLRGANGARVPLVLNRGGTGDNFTATVFSDAAPTPIAVGVAPFTGSFKPESPLSSFNGSDPLGLTGGVWTLELYDDVAGTVATLNSWTLDLTTAPLLTGFIADTQAWTVAVDPRSDTIYVGNDQGVWKLPSASQTTTYNWTRFGDSLPNVQVHDLVLNQTLNTLTAATYGRGMYQLFLTDYQPAVGGIRVISGNSLWTGDVTLTGDLTITTDGTQQIQNGIDAATLEFGGGVISDSTLGNTSTITKKGLGTLALSGSNTFGGQMLVEQGILRVKNPNALGLVTGNTIVASGAALELASSLKAEPILLNGDGIKFNGHFGGSLRSVANNNVYTGPITLGSNVTIGVDPGNDQDKIINPGIRTDSSLRIGDDPTGIIAGTGSINDNGMNFSVDKEQAGTLILSSANTIGGEIRVNQGALRVEDAGALGSTGAFAATKVLDGAQLQLARNAKTLTPTTVTGESLFLSGTGIDVTGALRNVRSDSTITGSNDNAWSGPITFTILPGFFPQTNPGSRVAIRTDDSLIPGVVDNLTIDTNIQQDSTLASFGLIKLGPGRATLTKANSFTGTTEVGATIGGRDFQGGSLRIESPNSLGPNAISNSVQTLSVVGLSGTFQLNFNGKTTGNLNANPLITTTAQVENALNNLTSVGLQPEQERIVPVGTGSYTLTFDGKTTTPITTASGAAGISSALNALSSVKRNEQQDILVSNALGFFTLTFNGERTVPLAVNVPASGGVNPGDSVENALNALTAINTFGTVTVAISPTVVPGAMVYRVTFATGSLASSDQPQIVSNTYTTDTVQNGAIGQAEIQKFALFITSGTFVLSYNGLSTIPLRFDATPLDVQDALNALPSIVGVGGTVGVSASGPIGARIFTLTYAGTLSGKDLQEIQAFGVGGPVTSVLTVQDGLGGSVTVGGPNFTVTFGGDLANRDVPQITAGNFTGSVSAVNITTTRPGAGVIVSETKNAGGRFFTVTFQRPLDLTVIPQIQAVNVSSGLAVNVATVQQGGAGAIVNSNTNGSGSLEIDGGVSGINVIRNVVLNGTGVTDASGTTGSLVNVIGNNTYSGIVTLGTDSQIGAYPTTMLTIPTLQDPTPLTVPAPALTKVGTGTVVFPNANAYGGQTTVRDGVLKIQNPQAIGTGRNEVQAFSTVGTVGAFVLTFNGQTTVPLLFGIPASGGLNPNNSVQNALNALSSLKRSEVQSVTLVGPTTGKFTLSFNGSAPTAPLNFNDTAGTVQSAFQSLSTVGAGNVVVSRVGNVFTFKFQGTLALKDLPLIVSLGSGGVVATTGAVQDGLNGTATVTSALIPGGLQYTVTFAGDLSNINLPEIITQSAMVFTNTTVPGSVSPPVTEVQIAEVFVTAGQTFNLTFDDPLTPALETTVNLPAGASALQVENALEALPSVRRNEVQSILVSGTSGTFNVTVTTPTTPTHPNGGTAALIGVAFNIPAATLQAQLEALPNIGIGNVQVALGVAPAGTTNYVVTFIGNLSNTNIPTMVLSGANGASTQLVVVTEGLFGDLTVTSSGVTGDITYTISFAGTAIFNSQPYLGDLANQDVPQITGTSVTTTASFINPMTVFDGNGNETQTVQVTATAGTFFLTFRGQTTVALLFSATAADVERALNSLTTIGGLPGGAGSVSVTKAGVHNGQGGARYTITFGGALADQNLPSLTSTSSGATNVVITTANDGPEGTRVLNNATLELQGAGFVMDREVVLLNGQGFQNQGALLVSGDTTWKALNPLIQIPLVLESNASIGTVAATDKIDFLLPITDKLPSTGTATPRNLDIYGPGTVIYESTGSALFGGITFTGYTGTTTVHDGKLLLSQAAGNAILGPLVIGDGVGAADSAKVIETFNNEIADTSTILVNSDGLFNLSGFSDTVSDVTVAGGHIDTGTGGQLTTGFIDMTGGRIDVRDNATVIANGNIGMKAGAMIVGATKATVIGNQNLSMDASSISFGDGGTLSVHKVDMTAASTIDFAAGGAFIADDVTAAGGHVAFGNNGSFNAKNVVGVGTNFTFGTTGVMNTTSFTETNGIVSFGNFGTLTATGNIAFDKVTVSFLDTGSLSAGGTLSAVNTTAITFGATGTLAAGDTTFTDSNLTMGDAANATVAKLNVTNGNLSFGVGGTSSKLTATDVIGNNAKFAFGDNGKFFSANFADTNGAVTFTQSGLMTSGKVDLSNTKVHFDNAGEFDAGDLTALMGSLVELLMNGILKLDHVVLVASALDMGAQAFFTATTLDLKDSVASFGGNSSIQVSGTAKLSGSDLKVADSITGPGLIPGLLQTGDLTMTPSLVDASTVSIGNLTAGLFGNITATNKNATTNVTFPGSTFTAGNDVTINAQNITSTGTDFTIGTTGQLSASAVSFTNAKLALGTDGTFNSSGNLTLDNGQVTLGDRIVQDPVFSTQSISMINGSKITLGAHTQGESLGIAMSNSTIAIGTAATHKLGGNVSAASTAAGQSAILGPGTLDMNGSDRTFTVTGPLDVDLFVTAVVSSGPTERLIKTGAGRLEFAPTTPFSGPVAIFDGDVQVDTTIGSVNLKSSTASLSGNGTVTTVDGAPPAGTRANGIVSPGVNWSANPYGTLHSNTELWGPNTTYFVNVSHTSAGAPVAGTDNDLLAVTGNVSINGAKLDGLFALTNIALGDQFTIITTTGAVTGKFAEPFGANVAFINGHKFTVQYNTTSVVLTKVLANIVTTSVTVTAPSTNPATQRQDVKLTTTLTPEPGAGFIPATSTVTYTFTNTLTAQVYTGTVNVGANTNQAVFDTNVNITGQSFLPGGSYTVTVMFNGDPVDFATSTGSLTGNPLVIEIPVFNTLTATVPVISPTNPTSVGIKDTTQFDASVIMERGQLQSWSFDIRNSANAIVRSLVNPTSPFGPTGAHTVVPISSVWDGKNTIGIVVPDGDYTVVATFQDVFGNTGSSNAVTIVVDNTTPFINNFANSNTLISPTLSLATTPTFTTISANVGDPAFTGHANGTFQSWTIDITPFGSSTVVRSFTNTAPGNVSVNWDGKNTAAAFVADGVYVITIRTLDMAGNTVVSTGQNVLVLNSAPHIVGSSNTPTVYGQSITITATVDLPFLPTTFVSTIATKLAGNPVEFYKDASTLLGTANLAAGAGNTYVATYTVPASQKFDAGTYSSMFVRYPGTGDFTAGNSANFTHVVTPATLHVAGKNPVNKVYGAAVPALDLASGNIIVTTSDLQYTDTAASVLSGSAATTATQASHVIAAGYPITQGGVTSNGNYNIVWTDGRLFVTKADLNITIDDKQRNFHAANPAFTFTASPLLLGDPSSVVSGFTLGTTATVNSPPGTYPITATGTPVAQDYNIVSIKDGTLKVIPIPTPIVIGPGEGFSSPLVKVYSPSGAFQKSFLAFSSNFTGGVRTTTGDFNRDGVMDIAVGTGPGTQAFVRVIDGATGADIFNVFPFESFSGGVFLSSGDINADGADELVITPDQGGGPRVVAYEGGTFRPFISYYGINDPAFRGGARAAVGDLNGDGYADIAVSAGFNGGPRISLWDGQAIANHQFTNITPDYFAYDKSLRNGAYVAIGDVDGDGRGDLITGAGPGGAPHVKIFNGADLTNPNIGPANTRLMESFFAGDQNNRGGVRVAVKSLDSDLQADLVTGVGDNGGSTATAYLGSHLANGKTDHFFDLDAFPGFTNGVFVG